MRADRWMTLERGLHSLDCSPVALKLFLRTHRWRLSTPKCKPGRR